MILDSILESKRFEVAEQKKALPFDQLSELVADKMSMAAKGVPAASGGGTSGADLPGFMEALSRPGLSLICEYKKASPSKGDIRADLEVEEAVRLYGEGGAAAISIITESKYFKGEQSYLTRAKAATDLPLLMKDFVVDEYQLLTARLLGASAVLLITVALGSGKLARYIRIAGDLGLDALVEVHDEPELETALAAEARIIGVNNRDLRSFSVSLNTAERLSALIPAGVCKVAESGMSSAEDIRRMTDSGFDAVLVGEALMASPNPGDKVREFLSAGVMPWAK